MTIDSHMVEVMPPVPPETSVLLKGMCEITIFGLKTFPFSPEIEKKRRFCTYPSGGGRRETLKNSFREVERYEVVHLDFTCHAFKSGEALLSA